ncbi:hypothetical protein ACFL24_00185 [Patescibacteria group bacterium]
MKKNQLHENYPLWTIFLVDLPTILVYAIGIYLTLKLGTLWGAFYIIYFLAIEFHLLWSGCRHCYYYNKFCAFGRGKISALLFKKGIPKKFCERKANVTKIIPSLLIRIFPITAGIILLVQEFNWFILILTIVPVLFWFLIDPFTFKTACSHCKQGKICCPASNFFRKSKK